MNDVKLTTFSTNADFASELETHAFTCLLKSLSLDFIKLAISDRNVLFNCLNSIGDAVGPPTRIISSR